MRLNFKIKTAIVAISLSAMLVPAFAVTTVLAAPGDPLPPTTNTGTVGSGGKGTTTTNTPGQTNTQTNTQPATVIPGSIRDDFGGKTLWQIFSKIIKLLLDLIVIVAVIVIIVAGFRMAAGGGNPAQITKAKSTIVWAIIGLVVAVCAFAIVEIIQKVLAK